MLRIDVNVAESIRRVHDPGRQSVRAGGIGARPEIWSFGLRNPWRYSSTIRRAAAPARW